MSTSIERRVQKSVEGKTTMEDPKKKGNKNIGRNPRRGSQRKIVDGRVGFHNGEVIERRDE